MQYFSTIFHVKHLPYETLRNQNTHTRQFYYVVMWVLMGLGFLFHSLHAAYACTIISDRFFEKGISISL